MLANRIASVFVRYGESSEENADIYAYAIEAILAALFNVIVCMIISLLFGRVVEGIIFLSAFALLRRFTGGYHASSHNKCILTFGVLLTCTLLITILTSALQAYIYIAIIIASLAWLGILALAPIDDEKKRYEGEAKAKMKMKSSAVSAFLLILCIITGFALNRYISFIISLSMFSVFGSMVYALFRRRIA
jgi:accessory gene regulator B